MDFRLAKTVRGWFTMAEGEALARLAAGVPAAQEIVEVGAFAGRSTAFLIVGSRAGQGAHITSLDDWSPAAVPGGTDQGDADAILAEYLRTLEMMGGAKLVTPLRIRSDQMVQRWLKPVGLLFLDATHFYEDTAADLAAWGAHVPGWGYAALHDYHPDHPGVVRAVDEAIASGAWAAAGLTGSLRILRRNP